MLRAITQSGTRTAAGPPGSLTNALRLTGSLPAVRQAPVRTWTSIPKPTIAHDHATVVSGFQSNQRLSATPRFLQSSLMATSVTRGFFTANAGSESVIVAGAGVAGRIVTRQTRQLSFQGLKQHIRAFSTSGIRSNKNSNALTRFAGNFTVDSSNKVVYTIVAINIAVFGTWQYAEGNAKRFHDGRLYMFMFRHFTDSLQNLKEGRVWTLVTSAFSHKEWYHILLNTMVLLSFGDPVWRLLGTRRFLAVYLGSAITASLSSIAYYANLEPYLRRMQHKPLINSIHYSMGASGSIMGITTAFACVYPMSQYSLFFVITMPAAALIGLFGVYELYNVLAANTGRFDSAGHLGGGLFGAAYYFTKLRPLMRR
ncbi:hypothetical protein BGZ96_012505 [Linnemannia gamsii]|uniref:Peptidase S54 rhomboid domain-containing protein n=1 Tax=Linnemannia gamsii TaxID=64522 RepID=A0ABQ7KAH8_9FUNG|nr:hypothetical protein BGZ96_012505 [Linnemannia gamsii]